jgi:radical SAM superfamily enzyme YgiQ (UPF0313 family)
MVGMPGETPETIRATTEFLLKCKPIIGHIPVLYPLPGTKVYEDAKANGTLQGDWSIDGPSPWVKLPWTETREELVQEARRISQRVQLSPGYLLYFLRHHIPLMTGRQFLFLGRHAFTLLRRS